MKRTDAQESLFIGAILLVAASLIAQETNAAWRSKQLTRFKAPEANQGVAVDEEFFYAIGNREIAKYRKKNGLKAAHWRDREDGRFIHLNAGVVKDGKLYAAHSNFPKIPMVSSVEVWDVKGLKHIDSHSLGETDGSLAWVDYHEGAWYAGFAHYAKGGGMSGRGPERTKVVRLDRRWRIVKEWTFPKELTDRFTPNSCSCAGFGPGGFLYATGHDAKELYVLEIPESRAVLLWTATVPVGFGGQGFAWDLTDAGIIYGISRKTREVLALRILPPGSVPLSGASCPRDLQSSLPHRRSPHGCLRLVVSLARPTWD